MELSGAGFRVGEKEGKERHGKRTYKVYESCSKLHTHKDSFPSVYIYLTYHKMMPNPFLSFTGVVMILMRVE